MALRDDIIATIATDIIPLLQDEVWPDMYEVIGAASTTANDSGGYTTTTGTIESGACYLKPINRMGAERAIADRLGWTTALTVDLPLDTVCTPANTLVVNGRTLNVGEVVRGGEFAYKAVAIVQEAG